MLAIKRSIITILLASGLCAAQPMQTGFFETMRTRTDALYDNVSSFIPEKFKKKKYVVTCTVFALACAFAYYMQAPGIVSNGSQTSLETDNTAPQPNPAANQPPPLAVTIQTADGQIPTASTSSSPGVSNCSDQAPDEGQASPILRVTSSTAAVHSSPRSTSVLLSPGDITSPTSTPSRLYSASNGSVMLDKDPTPVFAEIKTMNSAQEQAYINMTNADLNTYEQAELTYKNLLDTQYRRFAQLMQADIGVAARTECMNQQSLIGKIATGLEWTVGEVTPERAASNLTRKTSQQTIPLCQIPEDILRQAQKIVASVINARKSKHLSVMSLSFSPMTTKKE